jgi:hypothetical protein
MGGVLVLDARWRRPGLDTVVRPELSRRAAQRDIVRAMRIDPPSETPRCNWQALTEDNVAAH